MLEYGRARRDEEAELLDFANMVFSLAREPVDFLLAQPKVYSVPGFADISMVAREDGRIKGLVNAIHGTLILGEERLRYGYVGTVSTHPYERGRGIMKTLMNMVMERLEQEGCHFLALGGQRQRYGYFGFEDAGAAITLRFTEASIQHAPEAGPSGALRIMSMDEAGEDALGKARALHGAQALRCDRGMWDFLKLLRTEYAEPFAVLRGEEPVGYLADQENYLCEFACADGVDPAAAVSAFMRHKSAKDAQLVMPLHTLHREARLMAAADSWHIGPSFMARVLDWQAFLSALLRHAAATRTLREGEALLGIRGHGSYRLRVSGNGAEVEAVKTPAEFTLDARDAVAMLTLPLGNAMHPGNPLRDWLPLPFYMSELDSF